MELVPPEGDDSQQEIPAGDFASWLDEMQAALRGERDANVPCDGCTACCTSSQFVHIGPEETETLAHIPEQLLFPAPRLPKGHVLLGYDERGCCPMLVDGRCSIYAHRPRTCRTYDCRVFPAAGVELDDADKQAIAERTRRWRFTHASPDDQARHDAVLAAGRYLAEHRDALPDDAALPDDVAPVTATQRAVRAVELNERFLRTGRGPARGSWRSS